MKTIRTILVALAVSSALLASAQVHRTRTTVAPNNGAALTALQNDLQGAITQMEAALPIYDGYRVKSIHAAHEALGIVDKVISGAGASARPMSTAKDHIPSGTAKHKYTPQQLASSQADMQQGLNSLQGAAGAFQTAMQGQSSTKRSQRLSSLIQKAITDATTALNIHARTRA